MNKIFIILLSFSFVLGQHFNRKIDESTSNSYYSSTTLSKELSSIISISTLAGSGVSGSDDGTGTSASFGYIEGVSIDSKGNIFVAGTGNNLIRKITPEGVVTTFAGSGSAGSDDGTGIAASFNNPWGIAIDTNKNLFVSENKGHVIRKITPEGVVTTFAGSGTIGSDDGTGTAASFYRPDALTIDSNDNIYVTDYSNDNIRKITPNAEVTTFIPTSAGFDGPVGIDITSNDKVIYFVEYTGYKITKVIINSPPVINAIDDVTINEDESTTISLSATDSDGDSISFIVSADQQTELRFDGEDDYVLIPDNANLNYGTDDFAYSAWFKTESVEGTQQILHKRSGNNYEVQLSGSSIVAYIGEPGNEHSLFFSQISIVGQN